jgi:hypothetical protein
MNYRDQIIKLGVVLLSTIQPFILVFSCGELGSLSSYWGTSLQPLFILTNVIISYYFFTLKMWKIPSMSLVILTSFSSELYPLFHNFISAFFFISCLYPLYKTKRFKFYFYLYSLSPIIGFIKHILWFEIYSIMILCFYHLHSILHVMKILKEKHDIEK